MDTTPLAASFACKNCGIQSFPYLGNNTQCTSCHLKEALSIIKLYAIASLENDIQHPYYCNGCQSFLTAKSKGHKAGCSVYETIQGDCND
jgi:hypothetical protein